MKKYDTEAAAKTQATKLTNLTGVTYLHQKDPDSDKFVVGTETEFAAIEAKKNGSVASEKKSARATGPGSRGGLGVPKAVIQELTTALHGQHAESFISEQEGNKVWLEAKVEGAKEPVKFWWTRKPEVAAKLITALNASPLAMHH